MLGHLLSSLENVETSLPGSGPNGRGTLPLGHPTAHLLDCIPYRVALASPQAPPSSPAASTTVTRPWALAVRLLHPPMGAEDGANPPGLGLYTPKTIMECINATLVALCKVPQNMVSTSLWFLTLHKKLCLHM